MVIGLAQEIMAGATPPPEVGLSISENHVYLNVLWEPCMHHVEEVMPFWYHEDGGIVKWRRYGWHRDDWSSRQNATAPLLFTSGVAQALALNAPPIKNHRKESTGIR
jgi:hypothetical protein